ncbi:hypothetical protein ES319_D10G251600v1 [Gossypium barbadense]|uniref:UTP--glucose-1-phosphate uridylyltransferase n=1 Tax=Gossypium barbadense TaxID=3634 RepID=A0A5J5PYQ1_GOSBA|nr:hypothetical protein ES319_D10G251600v1 [Gossypium barbadense]
MLKQAIWKVLSKRVVSDSGDKLLLPCLYLPTTSFHAGQSLSGILALKFVYFIRVEFSWFAVALFLLFFVLLLELFPIVWDQVESTSESEGSASDEVLVVPYDNLAPISCDITESKQLLDKLVVVKYNRALGKNMGFVGPKWGLENMIKGKTSDMVIPSQAVAS